MFRSKLLSVIVPVFNSENTIERVLNHLVPLAEQGVQIWISDNCSTDGTRKIIKEFEKVKNFNILLRSKNLGGGSIKKSLGCVDTPWVLLVGSDDYLIHAEDVLEAVRLIDEKRNTVGLTFRSRFISGDRLIDDRTNVELSGSKNSKYNKFIKNVGCNSRFYGVIRTDLLKKHYYSEDYFGNDVVMSGRILGDGDWLYEPNIELHREMGISSDQMKMRRAYGYSGLNLILPPFRFILELYDIVKDCSMGVKINLFVYYLKIALSPIKHRLTNR